MKKMFHLFETEGDSQIYVPKIRAGSEWVENGEGVITEKLDGTSIRLTVRNGEIVRVEKRRNPTKEEKARLIRDPWYVDARPDNPADQYIIEAARNTSVAGVEDGEHSAEALGPRIQNNPYGLFEHVAVIHKLAPRYPEMLRTYDSLLEACRDLPSLFVWGAKAEGFVFHHPDGRMVKLRAARFWGRATL